MLQRFLTLLFGLGLITFASGAGLIGSYWPAYGDQLPTQISFKYIDIAYYFVTVTSASGFAIPADQSETELKSLVSTAHANGKKAVFSVGGWTGSRYFSDLVASTTNRRTLSNQINDFIKKYNFDGVDLDWEYPGQQGIGCNKVRAGDSTSFLAFLQQLRLTIGTSKLITAAISTAGLIGSDGKALTSMAPFAKYINIFNVMTYDIGGPWEPNSGPNSPLRTCKSFTSATDTIALFKKAGVPGNQIMLGIPTYGYSYTTKSSTLSTTTVDGYTSKVYQSTTGVTPKGADGDTNAPSTDVCGVTTSVYNGQWQYTQLLKQGLLTSNGTTGLNGYTRYYDACTQTPFLFNPSKRIMINYEDSTSAGQKASFAKAQGLMGVYTFSSDGFPNAVLANIRAHLN